MYALNLLKDRKQWFAKGKENNATGNTVGGILFSEQLFEFVDFLNHVHVSSNQKLINRYFKISRY